MAVQPIQRALLSILAAWTAMTAAQNLAPSSDVSTIPPDRQLVLLTTQTGETMRLNVDPLTNEAGLADTATQLKQLVIRGHLSTNLDVQTGDIGYLSCDPDAYQQQAINAKRALMIAAAHSPKAIVLYSTNQTRCSFSSSDGFAYNSLYTTTDSPSAAKLKQALRASVPSADLTQILLASRVNGTKDDGGSPFGKSPTTAVAMIVLYSITGIITALFLIIIVIGAVRAHRHPERYGPRHIVGRPRQSRAKGIARAVLDTLPIVKFGDREEDKPPTSSSRDMELGSSASPETVQTGLSGVHEPPQHDTGVAQPREKDANEGSDAIQPATEDETTKPSEVAEDSAGVIPHDDLACSVCTDDFVKGQDIRLLPCQHKFHPECIDPWLLNVSGTCPLCRVELQPITTNVAHSDYSESSTHLHPDPDGGHLASSTSSITAARTGANSPGPDVARHPYRRSRTGLSLYIQHTLNSRRMRDATPEERIAALRGVRAERQAREADRDSSLDRRGRNRLSARFSRAWSTASRPHSGVPSVYTDPVPESSSVYLPEPQSSS